MKIQIHLSPEGHKAIAQGNQLYSWNFIASCPYSDGKYPDRADHTLLAELDVSANLPSPEAAVHVALAHLKAKEQEIQATAFREVAEIQEERAKLLSLTYFSKEFSDAPY